MQSPLRITSASSLHVYWAKTITASIIVTAGLKWYAASHLALKVKTIHQAVRTAHANWSRQLSEQYDPRCQ